MHGSLRSSSIIKQLTVLFFEFNFVPCTKSYNKEKVKKMYALRAYDFHLIITIAHYKKKENPLQSTLLLRVKLVCEASASYNHIINSSRMEFRKSAIF